MVKKLPGMDDESTAAMAAQFTEGVEMGFLQDVEIWKNKAPIDNPPCSPRRTARFTSCVAGTTSSTPTSRMSRKT